MSGGVWAPYKELASTVNAAILGKEPDAYYALEAMLKKHKPDFISLLNNPVGLPAIIPHPNYYGNGILCSSIN